MYKQSQLPAFYLNKAVCAAHGSAALFQCTSKINFFLFPKKHPDIRWPSFQLVNFETTKQTTQSTALK